jgi:transcription elongation GreA/GreB family factor
LQAPLAQALIGAEEGKRVDFCGMPVAIEILAVEAVPD